MDFKDPPADMEAESKPENNGQNTPPTIQITNCDSDEHHDGFLTSETSPRCTRFRSTKPTEQNIGMVVNNGIPNQSPPSTQVADMYTSASNSVLNTIGANGNNIACDPAVPPIRSRNNSESNRIQLTLNHVPPALKQAGAGAEESER
ncbi:uncharacterized protein TNCT_88041 [Trichonephila clavata]|uniref:Uncharacterized protein n=1 Tax=Trichonephila clavata TaxID=2740835 RepID=A0A8X6FVL3_TRICU|nr:uncharacterized protein TNCT_88041 [Trichonephila clavata]